MIPLRKKSKKITDFLNASKPSENVHVMLDQQPQSSSSREMSHGISDLDSVYMETDNAFEGASVASAALKKTETKQNNIYLEQFNMGNKKSRKRVRCILCIENSDIANDRAPRIRLPAICTEEGTKYRAAITENHIKGEIHLACVRAKRLTLLNAAEKAITVPLIKMFNDGNKKLCNKIGGWILHAYNDAKILTLTAHNWPSRIVATEMQKMFDIQAN